MILIEIKKKKKKKERAQRHGLHVLDFDPQQRRLCMRVSKIKLVYLGLFIFIFLIIQK
jgi:hypothetical protein